MKAIGILLALIGFGMLAYAGAQIFRELPDLTHDQAAELIRWGVGLLFAGLVADVVARFLPRG